MGTRWVAVLGLVAVSWLAGGALRLNMENVAFRPLPVSEHATVSRGSATLRLLAVGDVNLGRRVGQEILLGDTLFPFASVKDTFARYDVVFANLESQLSDQGGETQHPRNNLIFSGPPGGGFSLKKAGITVVSTANNHALDYGVKALRETIRNLKDADVNFAGTAEDSSHLYLPAVISRNGIRLAFFAVTDVMNIEDSMWKQFVADADTGKFLPMVRTYRDSVDFIIVSYHGGDEYAEKPTARTRDFAKLVIRGGVDLFLGHHPHVPYGVEEVEGKYIVHSLGNFVFRQPDRYWTQRSYAFSATLLKDSSRTTLASFTCLPVLPGLQPLFARGDEALIIQERIERLSTPTVSKQIAWQKP